MMDFEGFAKIARLSRECVITEKIDGTNGQICVGEDGGFWVGSRSRWLTPETGDNHGFLLWAMTHKSELLSLGPGRHFGEWWGSGIQRGYGLTEKRFSLFNTSRWDSADRPTCCHVVPVLYRGLFTTQAVEDALSVLRERGSVAAPGFANPEGVVVYHCAGNTYFKKTIERDSEPKTCMRGR